MAGAQHFLDDVQYKFHVPEAVEFYEIMVRGYSTGPRAERILDAAGVDRSEIFLRQSAKELWQQALEVAARAGCTRRLAQTASRDDSVAAYHDMIRRLMSATPAAVEASAVSDVRIPWDGKELITGDQDTFLEMSFLHQGLNTAASVARLTTWCGDAKYYASGFLIAPDTILTNHHVLHDSTNSPVRQVAIWFNYEMDAMGRLCEVDSYEGDPATIIGDPVHDWAIIRTRTAVKPSYPLLSLRPSKPVAKGDFVYIVQHPGGLSKKIGLSHNQVVGVTPDVVQYLTDTLPGSSGSPVCNDLWQVVAIHHRGVEGGSDSGGILKNQGIHIARVVDGLVAHGILEPGGNVLARAGSSERIGPSVPPAVTRVVNTVTTKSGRDSTIRTVTVEQGAAGTITLDMSGKRPR